MVLLLHCYWTELYLQLTCCVLVGRTLEEPGIPRLQEQNCLSLSQSKHDVGSIHTPSHTCAQNQRNANMCCDKPGGAQFSIY